MMMAAAAVGFVNVIDVLLAMEVPTVLVGVVYMIILLMVVEVVQLHR